jgi:hypothetical protein
MLGFCDAQALISAVLFFKTVYNSLKQPLVFPENAMFEPFNRRFPDPGPRAFPSQGSRRSSLLPFFLDSVKTVL